MAVLRLTVTPLRPSVNVALFNDILLLQLLVSIRTRSFVLDVQELYFTARSAIEDSTSTPERLTGLWTKLEAAVMNLRKIQWHLITTKPCAEDILASLVQSLSTIEIRIGKVIEQYSCLVPFLREQLCYRAPVTSTEWVGRPSYVITKEQLEVMRSYGLSWVEIAKALGEPKMIS